MAVGNTSVSFDALLKELYSDDRVVNAIYNKNRFWAMVPKREDVDGREFNYPLVIAPGAARAATYTAVTTAEALVGEIPIVFKVPLLENFANASVSSKVIAQSGTNKGAFLKAVTLIADNQLKNFTNDIAVSMYRTSDGNHGQVGSIVTPSGGVTNSRIILKSPKDVMMYDVGQTVASAAAQVSGGLRTG